ncbi:hypothetical protein PIB30_040667 [Stylosanthes scabra]|uniref:Uncharacterized protein n=1 Tax=Stylosanthes scabra TaxID=79078 RepID=A0ABU6ZDD1_9FABA|nr:hypothetical protein [Stylosanthes scabra]
MLVFLVVLSYNRSRRFHCGDGSPTRRSSKASKTSTLIRLSRSLGTSRKVCYWKTNIRVLETVGLTTSPRSCTSGFAFSFPSSFFVYPERLPVAIIFISTNNSLPKLLKFRVERQSPLATRTPSLQTILTSVQSLRSTWGEGVSSMSEWLIDFKAQLTIQRNELRGLRNDFQGCPVISS